MRIEEQCTQECSWGIETGRKTERERERKGGGGREICWASSITHGHGQSRLSNLEIVWHYIMTERYIYYAVYIKYTHSGILISFSHSTQTANAGANERDAKRVQENSITPIAGNQSMLLILLSHLAVCRIKMMWCCILFVLHAKQPTMRLATTNFAVRTAAACNQHIWLYIRIWSTSRHALDSIQI